MSQGDLLLQWVSCHRELRAARLAAAASRLCAPPVPLAPDDPRALRYVFAAKRLARNLLRLGHVEEWKADSVRTVPPTILCGAGGQRILAGARSERLRERLAGSPGVAVAVWPVHRDHPAVWTVSGDEGAIRAAAAAQGFTLAPERGGELLASLPDLNGTLRGAPAEAVPERVERWNPHAPKSRWRWASVRRSPVGPGLYRTARKPRQWYLSQARGVPDVRLDTPERKAAAVWLFCRDSSRLGYCLARRRLSLPGGLWFPLLVDRALILASGRLPAWESGGWVYGEIDPARARHAARVVGVPLEMTK